MAPKNVISGFRNTSIWPFNPSKILNNPKAIKAPEQLPINPAPQPSTPIEEVNRENSITLFTPKKGQDIIKQIEKVGKQQKVLGKKAAKAINQLAIENTLLKVQLAQLGQNIEAFKLHIRKKVKKNANNKFNEIKEIIATKEASIYPPKKRRTTQAAIDERVVQEAQVELAYSLQRIKEAKEG